jgi:hypothetical protein
MRKLLANALITGAALGVVLTPVAASAATAHIAALAGSEISATSAQARMESAGDPDTTMTFTVSSGELSMTAPASANFGTGAPGDTLTGHLGNVEVLDNRAADNESWTATASETDFVNNNNSADTIPASAATYSPGSITTTGTITVTGSNITLANGSQTVVAASSGSGDNTATWNPAIAILLPASAVSGGYTGTLSQSVA